MWLPTVTRVHGVAVIGGCELPDVGVLGTELGPFGRATSVP